MLRGAQSVAPIARDHQVIVTHGNGPQVGLFALQAACFRGVIPYPLDVLSAESEGMIGYLVEQALANELPGREIATLLTQVEVDRADPAFLKPTKPIGPVYGEAEAASIAHDPDWSWLPITAVLRVAVTDSTADPRDKGDRAACRRWSACICAGGGGIPVAVSAEGWRGVEAVIDKVLSAALLAEPIDADMLILLTDVAGVWTAGRRHWTSNQIATDAECALFHSIRGRWDQKLRRRAASWNARACCSAIGAIEQAEAVIRGEAGTSVSAA